MRIFISGDWGFSKISGFLSRGFGIFKIRSFESPEIEDLPNTGTGNFLSPVFLGNENFWGYGVFRGRRFFSWDEIIISK